MKGSAAERADTKERLLVAADRLFFSRGYAAVSTRDLTEEAGVNVAAINYHFGSKENLYREALRQRLAGIARKKLAVLKEAIGEKDPPDLRAVVRAFVASHLEDILASREAERFANIVCAEMSEGGMALDMLVKELVTPVHRTMKDAVMRARPVLSDREATLCIVSIIGQVLHFIRAREVVKKLTGSGYSREFVEEIVDHITEFSLKGIGE
jgi:AcrR family transcriptional regulator